MLYDAGHLHIDDRSRVLVTQTARSLLAGPVSDSQPRKRSQPPEDCRLVSADAPNGVGRDSVDKAAAAFLCFGCRGAHSRPSPAKSDRAVAARSSRWSSRWSDRQSSMRSCPIASSRSCSASRVSLSNGKHRKELDPSAQDEERVAKRAASLVDRRSSRPRGPGRPSARSSAGRAMSDTLPPQPGRTR